MPWAGRTWSTSPGGTITRTVFDRRGRAVCTYVGTDDTGASDADPSAGREPCSFGSGSSGSSDSSSSSASGSANNNMVLVSEQEYHDDDCTGCSGGGGHLASTTQHVDASTTRTTEFHYDWRGRQEYVIPPADDQGRIVYTRYHFDNLDQVTKVERYQEQYPSADVLLARQESYFDDLGRTYETRRYAVNPSTGAVGNYLAGYTWYDAAGNVIKQQGEGQRSFTKTVFDGLGRAVKQYVGFDLDESTYAEADDVTGDTILEQTETTFDAAGNVLLVTSRQRRHDATGTGELTTMSGSQPQARVSYVAYWFDEVGRQKAVANYGTNGDSALTRPEHRAGAERHRAGDHHRVRFGGPGLQDHRSGGPGGSPGVRRRRPRGQEHPELPGRRGERLLSGRGRDRRNGLHGRWPDRHADREKPGHRRPGHHVRLRHDAGRLGHRPEGSAAGRDLSRLRRRGRSAGKWCRRRLSIA